MRENVRGSVQATGCLAYWWIIGLALIILTSLVGLALYPTVLNYQRQAERNSPGFVDTHIRLLEQDMATYNALDAHIKEAGDDAALVSSYQKQQRGILQEMQSEYDLIPASARESVPPSVTNFMAAHGLRP